MAHRQLQLREPARHRAPWRPQGRGFAPPRAAAGRHRARHSDVQPGSGRMAGSEGPPAIPIDPAAAAPRPRRADTMSMGSWPRDADEQRALIAFDTPADAPSWKRWLLFSPLARILIFTATTAVLMFLVQVGFAWLGWSGKSASMYQRATGFFFSLAIPTLAAYLFLVRGIERRRPAELAWRRLLPHGLAGFAMGSLLISAVVGVLWLLDSYHVVGTNPQAPWATSLLVGGLASAIAEELAFRGVLFRVTEEGWGTWFALALSALVFGILHTANYAATAWSSMAIAIEAGLLLGLVYHVWRSLPLCMGVHLGWNFMQGTV